MNIVGFHIDFANFINWVHCPIKWWTSVVYGCMKGAIEGVRSLYKFPKDWQTLNTRKWFIKRTRADWKCPTQSDWICSDYFVPDAFENHMKWSMGITKKLDLKGFHVLTKYLPGTCATLSSDGHTSKSLGRGSSAVTAVDSLSKYKTSPKKKMPKYS